QPRPKRQLRRLRSRSPRRSRADVNRTLFLVPRRVARFISEFRSSLHKSSLFIFGGHHAADSSHLTDLTHVTLVTHATHVLPWFHFTLILTNSASFSCHGFAKSGSSSR